MEKYSNLIDVNINVLTCGGQQNEEKCTISEDCKHFMISDLCNRGEFQFHNYLILHDIAYKMDRLSSSNW